MTGPVYAHQARTSDSREPRWDTEVDLVVLGSGVTGLTAALRARDLGLRVLVVTKDAVDTGSTRLAQGGVAVVLDGARADGDSVENHVLDTLRAGGGLCDTTVTRSLLHSAPAAVSRLREQGALFDAGPEGGLARGREGGHSAFRVIHAGGDATGAEVERALCARAEGVLPMLEHHAAVDALHTPSGAVAGVDVLGPDRARGRVRARAVLVATGGVGQLYRATSNPAVATGDGQALALRAGACLADIEFVQFHPTVLCADAAAGTMPLVTEALRGEGATLRDATGAPVMAGAHPLGDLAPRDVVSAAITRRLAAAPGGVERHVYLDATMVEGITTRFPTVYTACVERGIDPVREPIPVAPAAHFGCGGILTDSRSRTGVLGLYAAGEAARTGLHGANRLASNSLLEGLVTGARAAETIARDVGAGLGADRAEAIGAARTRVPVVPRDALQQVMSRYCAMPRTADGLQAAAAALDLAATATTPTTRAEIEDASLTLVARALIIAATRRTESRGCHIRGDCPDRDDAGWRHSQRVGLGPSGAPVVMAPANQEGVAA